MSEPARNQPGEIYARSPLPLGNGTFAPDGRLIVSHHPMWKTPSRVSIFTGPDTLEPFPDQSWNTPRNGCDDWLDAVLGLRADRRGRIWLLDMGTRSGTTPKFVVWDYHAEEPVRLLRLPSGVLTEHSEPNDFVIDERRQMIYIADESAGNGGDGTDAAIIIVNMRTGQVRRRLAGQPGIFALDRPIVFEGGELIRTGEDGRRAPMRVGVDGIALDAEGEWLYYGPLTGDAIWRLRPDDLLDDSLDDDALQERAERWAERPVSGGMWLDTDGSLYLTEVEAASIGRIAREDRTYRRILTREDLRWPDDVIKGPDGAFYVITSQLGAAPPLRGERRGPDYPFLVVRFRPDEVAGSGSGS